MQAGFGIPFVDYKRGDGRAIGPRADAEWAPVLIGDETPWVRDFRGLWGLDTEDPLGGERAPAGPRYERNGSVRTAWANPLGWSGLLKVPPNETDVTDLLAERVRALDAEVTELDARIVADRAALRGLRAQARSLQAHEYARALARDRSAEVLERETALTRLIATRTRLAEERRAHLATLAGPLPPEAAQAHLITPQGPRVEEQERRTRFLKLWSVISAPLLLVAVIVVLNARPLTWIATIGGLVAVFMGVEAFARRRFASFVASAALLVSAVVVGTAFVAVFRDHWRIAISVVIAAAALALLVGNLGDLRHRWRRG